MGAAKAPGAVAPWFKTDRYLRGSIRWERKGGNIDVPITIQVRENWCSPIWSVRCRRLGCRRLESAIAVAQLDREKAKAGINKVQLFIIVHIGKAGLAGTTNTKSRGHGSRRSGGEAQLDPERRLTVAADADVGKVRLPIVVEVANKDGIGVANPRKSYWIRKRKDWLGTLGVGRPAAAKNNDKSDEKAAGPKSISEQGKSVHEKGPQMLCFRYLCRISVHERTGKRQLIFGIGPNQSRGAFLAAPALLAAFAIAPVVVFLASDAARMVSGATYDVTGGDSATYTA